MKKLVDIREGAGGGEKGVIGTIYPIVVEDTKSKKCLFSGFCDFIINHRWIYMTAFEVGVGPTASEALSHCFFASPVSLYGGGRKQYSRPQWDKSGGWSSTKKQPELFMLLL